MSEAHRAWVPFVLLLCDCEATKTNRFFAFLSKGTNSEGFAFRGRRGRDTVLGR